MSLDVVRAHVRNGELALARQAVTNLLADAPEAERGDLYAWLARLECRTGRPREALAAAEEAVKRSDGWATALALGEAWMAVGEPFRARETLATALERLRATRALAPSASPDRAFRDAAEAEVWLGVALSEAHRSAGDPEAGLAVATRAVAFAEQAFGPASPEVAEALHAVGVCQHAAGHELQAREALTKALDLRRGLGADHPDVAATLDALGLVERARNRPFDAVKRHREALAIWTGRLGEHAGPVGGCRHALAQALHRTGDFQGAREEMSKALLVTGRTFGADHVDTWIARFELGRFDVDCGQMEEGFQAMEAARTRVRELLGRDHPVAKAMDRWL